MESSIFQRIMQAQTMYQESLLTMANVVGVATGYRNQSEDDEPAIVVLVQQKQPLSALSVNDQVPSRIDGLRTDVMEVGYLEAQNSLNPRQRFRPTIPGGASIGHFKVTAGTLGVMVYDTVTNERFILSNNHVIANSNEALPGDAIIQPGRVDGGNDPADKVAELARFIPLYYLEGDVLPPTPTPDPTPNPNPNPIPDPNPTPRPDPVDPGAPGCDIVDVVVGGANMLASLLGSEKRVTTTQAQASAQTDSIPAPTLTAAPQNVAQQTINSVDAALARPDDPNMFQDDILQIGKITGTKPVTLGQRVRKFGRTTSYTENTVNLLNATVNVAYNTSKGTRTARFSGQVIAGAMSQGGDSGSLIVDAQENRAVGLLFAGSAVATIFTPIEVVLNALNVKIVAV